MRASPLRTDSDQRFELELTGGRVAVEANERFLRKERPQSLLDALGALSDRLEREAAARTARWQCFDRATVVAAQLAVRAMHRQSRIAVAARRYPAASGAQQRRRVAAPVDEHQYLAAHGQMPAHCLDHRR